ESIAGGFASLPHSRVNIIWTVKRADDRSSFAKTLLENDLVLAADTATRVTENGQAMPANVVTVALKPEDVLRLELAKSSGSIALALRGFNDSSLSPVDTINGDGIRSGISSGSLRAEEPADSTGSPPVALPTLPAQPKTQPKTAPPSLTDKQRDYLGHILTITEGDQQREVNFKLDPK